MLQTLECGLKPVLGERPRGGCTWWTPCHASAVPQSACWTGLTRTLSELPRSRQLALVFLGGAAANSADAMVASAFRLTRHAMCLLLLQAESVQRS